MTEENKEQPGPEGQQQGGGRALHRRQLDLRPDRPRQGIPKMVLPAYTSNIRFESEHRVLKYGQATGPPGPAGKKNQRRDDAAAHSVHPRADRGHDRQKQIVHPQGDVLHLRGLGEGQVPQPGRVEHARRGPGDRHQMHARGLQAPAGGERRQRHREHHHRGVRTGRAGSKRIDLGGRRRRFRN